MAGRKKKTRKAPKVSPAKRKAGAKKAVKTKRQRYGKNLRRG